MDNYLLYFVKQTKLFATNGHKHFNTNAISMAVYSQILLHAGHYSISAHSQRVWHSSQALKLQRSQVIGES